MEETGRLPAKTERAQRLLTGTEKVGQLPAVTERNRLIQVGTEDVRVLKERDGGSSAATGLEGGMSSAR